MKLTTRGRYAVMAMVDLAEHGGEEPVCIGDIAERRCAAPNCCPPAAVVVAAMR